MAPETRDKSKSLAGNETERGEPTQSSRRRLVLADDDSLILEMVEGLLKTRYDVVGRASDGLALLEEVRRHRPDVAIVDISMPKLSGIEATRRICHSPQEVKIVILSVHDDSAYVDAAFDAGAHAYVLKQAAEQELIPAIETVAAAGSYVSLRLR
jgi:DNA-binding NarL/FixJ family response regulator